METDVGNFAISGLCDGASVMLGIGLWSIWSANEWKNWPINSQPKSNMNFKNGITCGRDDELVAAAWRCRCQEISYCEDTHYEPALQFTTLRLFCLLQRAPKKHRLQLNAHKSMYLLLSRASRFGFMLHWQIFAALIFTDYQRSCHGRHYTICSLFVRITPK